MSEAFKPILIDGGLDCTAEDIYGDEGSIVSPPSFPDDSAFAPPPNPLIVHLEQLYKENLEIARKKNADYASDQDPFANFNLAPLLAGISVERGILVRMSDKQARVSNLLDKPAQVADESIEDSLADLANYALILIARLRMKRNGELAEGR